MDRITETLKAFEAAGPTDSIEFDKIADILTPILPSGWNSVKLFIHITDGSYQVKFSIQVKGKVVQDYDLPKTEHISQNDLYDTYKKVYGVVKAHQKSHNWDTLTMSISEDGNFKTNFSYKKSGEETHAHGTGVKDKFFNQ